MWISIDRRGGGEREREHTVCQNMNNWDISGEVIREFCVLILHASQKFEIIPK